MAKGSFLKVLYDYVRLTYNEYFYYFTLGTAKLYENIFN